MSSRIERLLRPPHAHEGPAAATPPGRVAHPKEVTAVISALRTAASSSVTGALVLSTGFPA